MREPFLSKQYVAEVTAVQRTVKAWTSLLTDYEDAFDNDTFSKSAWNILSRTSYSTRVAPCRDGMTFLCRVVLSLIRRDGSGNVARWLARDQVIPLNLLMEGLSLRSGFVDAVGMEVVCNLILALLLSNRALVTEALGNGVASLIKNQLDIPGGRTILNALSVMLRPDFNFGDDLRYLTVLPETSLFQAMQASHWSNFLKRWSRMIWVEGRTHDKELEPSLLAAPVEHGLVHFVFETIQPQEGVNWNFKKVAFTGFGVDSLGEFVIESGIAQLTATLPMMYTRRYASGHVIHLKWSGTHFGFSGCVDAEKLSTSDLDEFEGSLVCFMTNLPYNEELWKTMAQERIKKRRQGQKWEDVLLERATDPEERARIKRFQTIDDRLRNDPTAREEYEILLQICQWSFYASLSSSSMAKFAELDMDSRTLYDQLLGYNKLICGPEETLSKFRRRQKASVDLVTSLITRRLAVASCFLEHVDADIESLLNAPNNAQWEARTRWFHILNFSIYEYYGQSSDDAKLVQFLECVKHNRAGNSKLFRRRFHPTLLHLKEVKDKELVKAKRRAGLLGDVVLKDSELEDDEEELDDEDEEDEERNSWARLGLIMVTSGILLAIGAIAIGYIRKKDVRNR